MARRAYPYVVIEGEDVTRLIGPYLSEFSYSDSIEGQADVCELTLQDADGIWRSDYFPTRGTSANITLVKEDWNEAGTMETCPLGTFEVDEITCSYPPTIAKIKFNSISNGAAIRGVDEFRSWEKTTLRQIASDIAHGAGLGLFFDAEDFQLERIEQSQESSLALLKKLCAREGLILKVTDNTIVIVDEERYEQRDSVATITYGSDAIINFGGQATINEIYGDTNVYFKSSGVADFLLGIFDMFAGSSNVSVRGITNGLRRNAGGAVMRITERVSSQAEANRLAKKKLREKNKHEIECVWTLLGDFKYLAGNVITASGFGAFDGKYIIDQSSHKMDGQSGYVTGLRCHRCLTGY